MSEKSMNNNSVENMRREYSRRTLLENDVAENPIDQFSQWFREALAADLPDANAMTLATASAQGRPSARIVLLKGFDETGFRFYTNYESRKGKELEEKSWAAVCFYWTALERQVRIEGKVIKLLRSESADYFRQRPRRSQLGAWASSQSRKVTSRAELEHEFNKVKQKFKGKNIPLPDFWGGYVLHPQHIEFWQGRPGRLHDRILYERETEETAWSVSRLSP